MKYNRLKIILAEKQIQITDFSEQLKMTRQGLQRSLDSDKLPYDKVVECCKLLGLTPNEFFEWENAGSFNGVYASNISGINTQNSNEAIKALKDQLKEKDRQISRLLSLIERRYLPGVVNDDGNQRTMAAESPAQYSNDKDLQPPQN